MRSRERQPDLAILDVNMPKLDGIEAARKILAEQSLPIVMLTAYADEGIGLTCRRGGSFCLCRQAVPRAGLAPRDPGGPGPSRGAALELREEFDSVTDELGAQRSVQEAKELLMRKEGLSAGDAFARLLSASKLSGQPFEVIAAAVVAAFQQV